MSVSSFLYGCFYPAGRHCAGAYYPTSADTLYYNNQGGRRMGRSRPLSWQVHTYTSAVLCSSS
jgi:hypothetical protein